jgi:hypothetical protein
MLPTPNTTISAIARSRTMRVRKNAATTNLPP